MKLVLDQETFVVEVPQVITYDVGRDGIGVVSETFEAGDVIVGQIRDGKIRYNAVHEANGKYYNTAVFLDPAKFKKADLIESDTRKITKAQASAIVLMFIGITFGLLVSTK